MNWCLAVIYSHFRTDERVHRNAIRVCTRSKCWIITLISYFLILT